MSSIVPTLQTVNTVCETVQVAAPVVSQLLSAIFDEDAKLEATPQQFYSFGPLFAFKGKNGDIYAANFNKDAYNITYAIDELSLCVLLPGFTMYPLNDDLKVFMTDGSKLSFISQNGNDNNSIEGVGGVLKKVLTYSLGILLAGTTYNISNTGMSVNYNQNSGNLLFNASAGNVTSIYVNYSMPNRTVNELIFRFGNPTTSDIDANASGPNQYTMKLPNDILNYSQIQDLSLRVEYSVPSGLEDSRVNSKVQPIPEEIIAAFKNEELVEA